MHTLHTYIPLHYITLHYTTLHYITYKTYNAYTHTYIHFIALHYITLHYITAHTVHTCISIIFWKASSRCFGFGHFFHFLMFRPPTCRHAKKAQVSERLLRGRSPWNLGASCGETPALKQHGLHEPNKNLLVHAMMMMIMKKHVNNTSSTIIYVYIYTHTHSLYIQWWWWWWWWWWRRRLVAISYFKHQNNMCLIMLVALIVLRSAAAPWVRCPGQHPRCPGKQPKVKHLECYLFGSSDGPDWDLRFSATGDWVAENKRSLGWSAIGWDWESSSHQGQNEKARKVNPGYPQKVCPFSEINSINKKHMLFLWPTYTLQSEMG